MLGHVLVEGLVKDGQFVVHVVQFVVEVALLPVQRVAVDNFADVLRQLPVLIVSPLLGALVQLLLKLLFLDLLLVEVPLGEGQLLLVVPLVEFA